MMLLLYYILIFGVSVFVLSYLSSRLIDCLLRIAGYLKWREFIIAFFGMAFATSLTNFFVDVNAVLHHLPELAFGDIIGGNLVDLTLIIAISVFLGKKGGMEVKSETVQKSAIFTALIAILPLLLIADKKLDRIDGLILVFCFVFYSFWIFSKQERFKKYYIQSEDGSINNLRDFMYHLFNLFLFFAMLILASQGIVKSAIFFAEYFQLPILMVGTLIVGLGNCLPELYFSIISARQGQYWLVLGELMGSVIVCTTLVLGIIVLLSPFSIDDLSPFWVARGFMILASLFFFYAVRSDHKITKKEAVFLLFIYILFLISEILVRIY